MTSPRTSDDSHGHAVRATSILGGASVMNVALGLIRMKVAAVVLGPVGVGLIGLLQNLLNAAATVGGLNIGIAGARQIVASDEAGGQDAAASARRATFITASVMAVASAVLFWLLRNPLSMLIFGSPDQATNVGFLALGVAATAAAGYQTAVLTAARRIGDLARLSVISGAVAAIVGSTWILIGHSAGIVPFILASPVATLTFGWIFVRRLPTKPDAPAVEPLEPHVANLLRLGAALTVSIFVSLCGQLLVRTIIERKLGGVKLGHFQAAWTITTVYLFFIFQSMGSNYLPRLTAVMRDREQAQKMVCVQAEVGMILAAPILLTMIGAAPWALSILYTSQFVEASTLLRWQMLGDLVRLASWPIAFVLLAGGAGRDYTLADVAGTTILVTAAWLLIPVAGLSAPGIAYVIMNVCYCGAVMGLVSRRYEIGLSAQLACLFALLAVSCVVVFAVAGQLPVSGAIVGVSAAALWALFGFSRLRRYGALPFGRAAPL